MFRKKKLRKQYDRQLIQLIENVKQDWDRQNQMKRLSVEQNEELHYETLLTRAKFVFLLREAKWRKVSVKK